MLCNLRELKPNPMRDFTVDPIDDETVEKLKQSIKEDGFWGGVVARKIKGGDIQVAAGWHRVKAAIKAGLDRADIFIADDMDDAALIRVYARENATQRGNTGTAQAGTIAAAIRFLAKVVMNGTSVEFNRRSLETARGQIATDKGIGRELIVEFLKDVPGVNENSVRQQLAMLKESGDYARIIDQVREEIELENKEALKALEKAERERKSAEEAAAKAELERKEATSRAKAAKEDAEHKRAVVAQQRAEAEAKLAEKRQTEARAEAAKFDALRTTVDTARKASNKANGVEITFNFEGVAKHLTQPSHIETFRKVVTAEGIRPFLPVAKQAALASELVKRAKTKDVELTGAFIKDNVGTMVHSIVVENKKIAREEAERLARQNWESQWKEHQHNFARQVGAMMSVAMKMAKHAKTVPDGVTLYMTSEFKDSLKRAKEALKLIDTTL